MSKEQSVETASFEELGLPDMLLKSIKDVGYDRSSRTTRGRCLLPVVPVGGLKRSS